MDMYAEHRAEIEPFLNLDDAGRKFVEHCLRNPLDRLSATDLMHRMLCALPAVGPYPAQCVIQSVALKLNREIFAQRSVYDERDFAKVVTDKNLMVNQFSAAVSTMRARQRAIRGALDDMIERYTESPELEGVVTVLRDDPVFKVRAAVAAPLWGYYTLTVWRASQKKGELLAKARDALASMDSELADIAASGSPSPSKTARVGARVGTRVGTKLNKYKTPEGKVCESQLMRWAVKTALGNTPGSTGDLGDASFIGAINDHVKGANPGIALVFDAARIKYLSKRGTTPYTIEVIGNRTIVRAAPAAAAPKGKKRGRDGGDE